jgi:hypothetical protein
MVSHWVGREATGRREYASKTSAAHEEVGGYAKLTERRKRARASTKATQPIAMSAQNCGHTHVEAGGAVQNRLREAHKVRGRSREQMERRSEEEERDRPRDRNAECPLHRQGQ